jgi:hypothetical protein
VQVAESLPTADQIYGELIEALDRTKLAGPVERLQRTFPIGTAIFVVGGFARDCARALIERHPVKSKDLDIIIDTNSLANELEKFNGKLSRTPLGGFHWIPVGASGWIDVWQLSDTVWIRAQHLPSTIEAFLNGVDLNIDRIAVGLHNHTVMDRGCLSGLVGRFIDLDATTKLKELALDELARAVVAHLKTGYALSERVLSSLDHADLSALLERSSERLAGDGYTSQQIGQVRQFILNRREALLATSTQR